MPETIIEIRHGRDFSARNLGRIDVRGGLNFPTDGLALLSIFGGTLEDSLRDMGGTGQPLIVGGDVNAVVVEPNHITIGPGTSLARMDSGSLQDAVKSMVTIYLHPEGSISSAIGLGGLRSGSNVYMQALTNGSVIAGLSTTLSGNIVQMPGRAGQWDMYVAQWPSDTSVELYRPATAGYASADPTAAARGYGAAAPYRAIGGTGSGQTGAVTAALHAAYTRVLTPQEIASMYASAREFMLPRGIEI